MSKIKQPSLRGGASVPPDTPIGICIPVYNAVGNENLAAAVFTIENCCDLPYQLSLGIGPNCVAKNRRKALGRLDPSIKHVLMCDDDVLLPPHFASKLLSVLLQGTTQDQSENPGLIGAVSAVMMGPRGEKQNHLHPSMIGVGETVDTIIPGTCFMYNRKLSPIDWDVNYKGSQWEDTDGIMQLRDEYSLRTVATGNVQIMHRNPMSGGGRKYWNENRAYFISKWGEEALR